MVGRFATFTFLVLSFWAGLVPTSDAQEKPNIVFILADDWGMGDIKCYGNDLCRIDTPNMDRLAGQGMRFTDAHSSSSVCTPTRYGVLTGRYNWRSRMKKGVLGGFSAPLMPQNQVTVASLLKKQGYQTACIGKWHLGMNMPTTDGKNANAKLNKNKIGKPLKDSDCNIEWGGKITGGPNSVGFDYFYGISASLDMPPYIWIYNDSFVGECTTVKKYGRIGPAHKDFHDYDVLPTIAEKSVEFIQESSKKKQPFFLYVPLNAPHTPISPSKRFAGKSGLGKYADFVMETDWAIGQIVESIQKAGLDENTLIIVTADNGCSPAAKRARRSSTTPLNITFNQGKKFVPENGRHYPSGELRGHKADIYEGGHRVPFIAKWAGKIKKGKVCHQPICLVDLMSTCVELTGIEKNEKIGVDSYSFLPILLQTGKGKRQSVVHHSINGSFALRRGKWKLVFCPGSGGWSNPKPKQLATQKNPSSWVQLFDLENDPSETTNLASSNPEVVDQMTKEILDIIRKGRSTPGPNQSNDGETHLYPKWIRTKKN